MNEQFLNFLTVRGPYVDVFEMKSNDLENLKFRERIVNTPSNISAYILTYGMESDFVFVNCFDNIQVISKGIYLDRVPNQEYLFNELQPTIIAMQLSETRIPKIEIYESVE